MEFYIAICILVGLFARKSRVGFVGITLLSLILTPVVVVIGLIALVPPRERTIVQNNS